MMLSTDLETEHTFYTDTNNLGFHVRTTDKSMPTQGNFYPITSYATLRDSKYQINVLIGQGIVRHI